MAKIVVIGGENRHRKIMDVMKELTPEEMKMFGVVDLNEIKNIPCITTNDFDIINKGYSKQRKPKKDKI